MLRMGNIAAAGFTIAATVAVSPGASPVAGRPVTATPARPRVALVLFHGCHSEASSRDWQPLVDAIPPGFARIVAVDLPGHGSAGGKKIEAEGDNSAWMAAWRAQGSSVVDRAFARARTEAPGAFVAAGGAGCGGFFALMGAERHAVDALVTLSGLSDQPQRERLTSRRTPVLGMASKGDRDVPARVEAIVSSGGPGSTMKIYPGAAHGTTILADAPESAAEIVRWIEQRIAKPGPGGPPEP